jgi:hypothetical protein
MVADFHQLPTSDWFLRWWSGTDPFFSNGARVSSLTLPPLSAKPYGGEKDFFQVSFFELWMFPENRMILLSAMALEALEENDVIAIDGLQDEEMYSSLPIYEQPPELRVRGGLQTRLEVVDDSGFKGRVISVFPWFATYLGHLARTLIKSVMKGDRIGIIPTLVFKGYKNILSFKPPFYSLDLSSATDRAKSKRYERFAHHFGQEAMKRNDGDDWIRRIFPVCNQIFYQNISVLPPGDPALGNAMEKDLIDQFPYSPSRYAPMGCPPNWLLLCLDLMFMYWQACRDVGRPWKIGKDRCAVFCGDDAGLSNMPPDLFQAFRKRVIDSGHKPSPGTDVYSDTVLQYVERIWFWDPVLGQLVETTMPAPSCLLKARTVPRLPGRKRLNLVTVRGEAASNALQHLETRNGTKWNKRIHRVACLLHAYNNHATRKYLKERGIPLYLPRVLGGYGAPHHSGHPLAHVPPYYFRCIRVLLRSDTSIEHMRTLCSLARTWTFNPANECQVEARRLTDLWLDSVLIPEREFTTWEEFEFLDRTKYENCPKGEPCWVNVEAFSMREFGQSPKTNDWKAYDLVKDYFKEKGIPLVPLQSAIDHVFKKNLLECLWFYKSSASSFKDEPSISDVVHATNKAYSSLHEKFMKLNLPMEDGDQALAKLTTGELVSRLSWRMNQFLIFKSREALKDYSGKW